MGRGTRGWLGWLYIRCAANSAHFLCFVVLGLELGVNAEVWAFFGVMILRLWLFWFSRVIGGLCLFVVVFPHRLLEYLC